MAPALAFLCAGVPLASLLDRFGFFESVARFMQRGVVPVAVCELWVLAAATTVVLNLDTTVMLLTPLYIRMAKRSNVDPLPLAVIPVLLASLASSVLPVSNLTTLIVADQVNASVSDVIGKLALPTAVAVVAGWLAYRRRFPAVLPSAPPEPPNRRALVLGGTFVAGLLVAFTAGPAVGVQPWMAVVAADAVLVCFTRLLP